MPALASPSTWRTAPYSYRGYLYVDHDPTVVFRALVNQASFTYPLAQVTFDTVTVGAFGDISQNMTVLFGTTSGADDLGRQRVRKAATSTVLYIGESSQGTRDGEVNPADNMFITVLNERRIWAIPPRGDLSTKVLNKDYDATLVTGGRNFGLRPGPLASGGCYKAAIVDSVTALATFKYDGTNSILVSPGSTLTSYAWDVIDGTITVGSASTSTITATFPVGRRYVKLTVTDSNGDAHTCYILTLALDPNHATWFPITDFEITEHLLLPEGAAMSFIVHEAVPPTTFVEGAAVIYFEQEYYNGVKGSLAGPSGDEAVKFVGWVDTEREEPEATEQGIANGVEFRAISTSERMRRIQLLPQLGDNKTSPVLWSDFNTLTTTRFLLYLIYRHSTVLDVAQMIVPNLTDIAMKALATAASTLYEQADELAKARAKRLTCDQRGILRLVDDPLLLDSGSRTSTVILDVGADDFSPIVLERERHPREYWIDGRGITTGTSNNKPCFAIAPGKGPGQGAARSELAQQLVASQTELNSRTGHHYARVNAAWRPLDLAMYNTGDAGIDPAFMEWITVSVPATTNRRGRALTTQRCLPTQVNIEHSIDAIGGARKEVQVTAFIETVGQPAQTVIIPPAPKLPAFEIPQVALYPTTNWDIVAGGQPAFQLHKGRKKMAMFDHIRTLYTTSDFDTPLAAGAPTWAAVDLGTVGPNTFSNNACMFTVDPFSPLYLGSGTTVNGWLVTETGIYRITDVFGTVQATLQHTFAVTTSILYTSRTIIAGWGLQNWVMVASYHGGLGLGNGTKIAYTTNGTTWTEVTVTSFESTNTLTDDSSYAPGLHVSSRSPGTAYVFAYPSTGAVDAVLYKSADYGATWALATDIAVNPGAFNGFNFHVPWDDNTNQKLSYHRYLNGANTDTRLYRTESDGTTLTDISPIVGGNKQVPNHGVWSIYSCPENRRALLLVATQLAAFGIKSVYKSLDGGDNWTTLIPTTSDPPYLKGAIGGDNQGVIYLWGVGGAIAYSSDGGVTIESKKGNISTFGEILAIAGG